MVINYETVLKYLTPLAIIVVSGILGLIFKKYFHHRLKKLAEKTRWKGDEIILGALENSSILWFILGGVYFAVNHSQLPQKLISTLITIVIAVLILSITFVLSRISVELLQLYAESTGGAFPSTSMFKNLTRILIITIGFLVLFQTLGVSITPILTALGIGGLAISLALKDTLSDLFAGLHILLSKKLKPGDLVALESGKRGTVENISWRDTTIRDRQNNLIVIPNSNISSAMITNFDVPVKEMVVRIQCGVSYDSDLEHVERVTLEVAKDVMQTVPGGVPDCEPTMKFHTFGESSIDFRVSMRAKDYLGQFAVTHEFIKRLHKRFNEEGINIPFPIRTIYQGN